MEASWHKKQSKTYFNLKQPKSPPVLEICLFFNKFGGPGPPKSIKNRSKKEVKMGRHLGIDFYGFQSIFGPKLGRKMQEKLSQAKTGEDKKREGKGEERKREARIGKEKRSRWTFFARGWWVHPPFRGRPPQRSGPLGSRVLRATSSHLVAILVPSIFPSLFRCLLGSILAPFSLPTCFQKSTKIH